jgi:hypothetical protein
MLDHVALWVALWMVLVLWGALASGIIGWRIGLRRARRAMDQAQASAERDARDNKLRLWQNDVAEECRRLGIPIAVDGGYRVLWGATRENATFARLRATAFDGFAALDRVVRACFVLAQLVPKERSVLEFCGVDSPLTLEKKLEAEISAFNNGKGGGV